MPNKMYPFTNYQDSIHYRNSCSATIVIVKFLLSLCTMCPPFAAKDYYLSFEIVVAAANVMEVLITSPKSLNILDLLI